MRVTAGAKPIYTPPHFISAVDVHCDMAKFSQEPSQNYFLRSSVSGGVQEVQQWCERSPPVEAKMSGCQSSRAIRPVDFSSPAAQQTATL